MKQKLLAAFILSFCSLNALALPLNSPSFLNMYYFFDDNHPTQSGLLMTDVSASHWLPLNLNALLSHLSPYVFSHMYCSQGNCILFGVSFSQNKLQSFFIESANAGRDWALNTNIIGDNFDPNYIVNPNNLDCQGSTCLMTGFFDTDNEEGESSYVLLSQNGGRNWVINKTINQLFPGSSLMLSASFCPTADDCLAVGSTGAQHDIEKNSKPVILVSHDSGSNWQIANVPVLTGWQGASFTALKCSADTCLAAGEYKENNNKFPFVVLSHDQGRTWTLATLPKTELVSSQVDLNCGTKACMLLSTTPNGDSISPFLMRSVDEGQTWNIVNPFSQEKNVMADYVSLHCSDTLCVFTGGMELGTKSGDYDGFPLIAVTRDQGLTWQVIRSIQNLNNKNSYTEISGVNCYQSACVLEGMYTTNVNDVFPCIINTRDGTHFSFQQVNYPETETVILGYTMNTEKN